MIPETARRILKLAAGYSIAGPLLLTTTSLAKLCDRTAEISGLEHGACRTSAALFGGVMIFNGIRYARFLRRGEKSERLRKAIAAGSWPLFFLPFFVMPVPPQTGGGIGLAWAWVFFCATAVGLLGMMAKAIEPQIFATLAKESAEMQWPGE